MNTKGYKMCRKTLSVYCNKHPKVWGYYKDDILLGKELNSEYDSIKEQYIGKNWKYRGIFSYLNNKEQAKIKTEIQNRKFIIAGIGGAAGSILNRLKISKPAEKLIHIDTDCAQTNYIKIEPRNKLLLGNDLKGNGCGASFALAEGIAKREIRSIGRMFSGYNHILLVAGLGGGVGSGMLPVIAKLLAEQKKQVFVIATTPFLFEGVKRKINTEYALLKVKRITDNVIIVPNQVSLMKVKERHYPVVDALKQIDGLVAGLIKGLACL